jgi:hypothetical protein
VREGRGVRGKRCKREVREKVKMEVKEKVKEGNV